MKGWIRKSIIAIALASYLFTACSSGSQFEVPTAEGQTQTPTELGGYSIILATQDAIKTQAAAHATERAYVPEVDFSGMQIEQIALLILEGNATYPTEFSDEQRAELAIAIADYMNLNVVGDEVFVDVTLEGRDEVRICWNYNSLHWVANLLNAQVDCSAENFPPLIIAGYTNLLGREVYIDPESGQEVIVPRIVVPAFGEMTLTELYGMDETILTSRFADLIAGAEDRQSILVSPQVLVRISELTRGGDFLRVPTIIRKNVNQKKGISYSNLDSFDTARIIERKTNSVLIPLIDPESKQVFAWLNVHQGYNRGYNAFTFSLTENFVFYRMGERNPNIFGAVPTDLFGILISRPTIEEYLENQSDIAFLETGTGVGSVEELNDLIGVNSIQEISQIIEGLRLFVISPSAIIHNRQ